MYLRKGDSIKIIIGKDNGKTGKILKVLPKENKVLIEGLNVFKKHTRPKRQGEKGEVVDVSRPMHASNVMLVCSSCGKPRRVGVKVEKNKRVRYCKKCSSII